MPRDCASGRKTRSKVGSLDPDKLGYCPGCYAQIQDTLVIPFDEFKEAVITRCRSNEEEEREPQPLDGTAYGAAMVYSAGAGLQCEKCKTACPPGSLVIGVPGTKTVMRAYDPGTHVWRGPVGITKSRHPQCMSTTKRMIAQLTEVLDDRSEDADAVVSVFRCVTRLSTTVRKELVEWMNQVTSPEAAEDRVRKRKHAMGYNEDGSKKPKGTFKPKGPPESWKTLASEGEPFTQLTEKSASALKNSLKTYTYEKVSKSISKAKLVELIVSLFAKEG